jgi:hypothetical protein
MYTVQQIAAETGYSRDQILKACHRKNIEKVGKQFVIKNENEKGDIIEEIESRCPGNPNIADLRKKTFKKK